MTSPEIRPPLMMNNPLLMSADAILHQKPTGALWLLPEHAYDFVRLQLISLEAWVPGKNQRRVCLLITAAKTKTPTRSGSHKCVQSLYFFKKGTN
jgi:hypothetical protein